MSQYDFEKFFELSLDMLCIAGTDGYFKRVNPSFQRVLGWTPEELTGRPFIDFVHPDDIEATLKEVEKLASRIPTISFRNRYQCSNGYYRHLLWTAFPEKETGLFFAIAHDTTELVEANQRFQLAVDASPVSQIMVDQHGLIQLINRETERLFGYSRDLLIGKSIEMLVPATIDEQHQRHRSAFFQNPGTRLMGEGRHVRAMAQDGREFPAEIGLNPVQFSDGVYVLCTVIDLTFQKKSEERMMQLAKELEEANAQLSQLAMTDRLTSVFNRHAFDEQLDHLTQLMQRMGKPLSLLMIDIDHFKRYNDRYGHPMGDEALKTVASLLCQNARTSDVVARYGGEEFAIIMPNTAEEEAMQLSDRLRKIFHAHEWEKEMLTISIGASTIFHGKTVDETKSKKSKYDARLIIDADQALYYSKNNGRDRATHVSEIPGTDHQT